MERVLRTVNGVVRRGRAWKYRVLGVQIAKACWLQAIDVPQNYFDISLDEGVALDRGVTLLASGGRLSRPRIAIGASTYINRYTIIDASEGIEIGAKCMIGPFCYITDHNHGTKAGVPVQEQPLVGAPVMIEEDAWIGAHVTVLKGVRIGRGAVVGAGAVVTRNVPDNAIVAGVPAGQIGVRRGTAAPADQDGDSAEDACT